MRNVRSNNTNKTDLSGDVVVLDSARKSAPIVEVVDTGSADRLHKRIAEIIAQSSNPDGLTEIINSEVARCVLEIDAWTGKAGAELTKLMPAPAVLTAGASVDLKPHIVVFGVGGAGGNAVNNMIEAGLEGVEFVVANTDAQQLAYSKTQRRIQLGVTVTQGLGSGAHPEIGISAAEESDREIGEHLDGADMVFITAGMGGGTGTGAAPFIAKCARERGILTVGVVTKPFNFEGRHRMRLADAGIAELQRHVDTLIVIPNQNLFRVANERTTFAEAFAMADQVLHAGVRSITDLMVLPGLINLDFADVRTVMAAMGKATIGTGEATGEDRALIAAQSAIANPLLDEVSLKGAKAVLVNVTGGRDMTLLEIDEATNLISDQVDPEANIIFGAAFDPSLDGKIRVSVVATGMGDVPEATVELVERSLVQTATAQPFEPKVMATVLGATPKSLDMPPVMLRVVDPAVTEEGDVSYVDIRSTPLSASPPSPKRERWLSLFGTGRVSGTPSMAATPLDEPRQPRMSVAACIGQAAASDPQPQVESIEADLDIPSFLRRLAN